MDFQIFPQISKVLSLGEDPHKGVLFIGNIKSSQDKNLQEFNIKAVISAINGISVSYDETMITHLYLKIEDKQNELISIHFDICYDFIEKHLQSTNVLVHCLVGISRSASIIIYYLMKKNKWDYYKAYDFLKKQRKCIQPNTGFANQLEQYGLGQQN